MNRIRLAVAWIATVTVAYAAGYAWVPAAKAVSGAGKYFPPRRPDTGRVKADDTPSSRADQLRRTLARQFKPGRFADMARLLEGATPEELRGLADLMAARKEMPSSLGRLLLVRWGAVNGPAALAWLKADGGRHSNPQDFSVVIGGWASRDPAAAMDWVGAADKDVWNKDMLLNGALLGWAQRDLTAMTRWLMAGHHPPEFAIENYAAELSRAMIAGRGMDAFLNWTDSLQTMPRATEAFMKLAFESTRDTLVTSTDVDSAVAFLRRNAPQPWCQTEDVERLLWSVCDRQPDKVLEASAQLGPDPKTGKYYLAEQAITTWCERNQVAAAGWLQRHTDSPLYGECAPVVEKFLAEKNAAAKAGEQESSSP